MPHMERWNSVTPLAKMSAASPTCSNVCVQVQVHKTNKTRTHRKYIYNRKMCFERNVMTFLMNISKFYWMELHHLRSQLLIVSENTILLFPLQYLLREDNDIGYILKKSLICTHFLMVTKVFFTSLKLHNHGHIAEHKPLLDWKK